MKDIDLNFRREFGELDDAVLIGPAQLAAVIGAVSVGAVYVSLARGALPEPLIRENRKLRWSVGQVRAHVGELAELCAARVAARLATTGIPQKLPSAAHHGRPRNTLATANSELQHA